MTHAADHDVIHSVVGLGLPTNLAPGSTGHVGHHNTIHSAVGLGLPTNLTQGSTGHTVAHTTISGWMADATVGVRGTVGPRAPSAIPEYPQSGLVSISAGAHTIQDAITANGDNTKFQLQAGTYNIDSTITPKAGQEFWGASGVTISGNGTQERGFVDAGSRNGVKIMNVTMSGFTGATYNNRAAIHQPAVSGASSDWTIGYLEVFGDTVNVRYGIHTGAGVRTRIHHSKLHDFKEGAITGNVGTDCLTEDCELYNAGGTNGQKWVRCNQNTVRHCWMHNMNGTSLWHDTANRDCLVEWNLIESGAGEAIEFEISGNFDNTLNIVRYNVARNNNGFGLFLSTSSRTAVYQNTFTNNGLTYFIANAGELITYVKQSALGAPPVEGLAYDLKDNSLHHNTVTVRQDAADAKGATMHYDTADAPTDPSLYTNNSKNNVWANNTYDLLNVSTGKHFRWGESISANNITWASWLTKPIPGGGTQDTGSSAS